MAPLLCLDWDRPGGSEPRAAGWHPYTGGRMSRFEDPQDPLFRALNSSISFDIRLAPFDLDQSRAHARMLAAGGIITGEELQLIESGLAAVREEIEQGRFVVMQDDEDVHMAIERRLTEIVGPVGGKLQTARSRNDQVATDVAMLVRAHSRRARLLLRELMATLLELAERHLDWPMPGYTHLQRAQPVYLSHHLLAWFWKFRRDRERFGFCERATEELPLGAGALAGVNFETDRTLVAEELGFGAVAQNSLDAVSNRDFVLDYLSAASTCAGHLSQLGGEIVLWSTAEFGFCQVADAFASGSSLMPQKKNPDAAELLRAKAPRIVGRLVAFHGVLHGLPLTYNKDLQEDKEPLFDTVDTLELCLRVACEMLAGIEFRRERMAAAAADEFIAATDVADLLVREGVPFREAHGIVGGVVRAAAERRRRLSELTDDELGQLAPRLPPEHFRALLEQSSWLESKVSEGGTALPRVREQLARARRLLEEAGS
jgi:argininosuccinate lyase